MDRCTTKHEVQTLLQTKMDSGHMDANFNIAILDCHKVGVAFFVIESNDNKCPGKHEKEFVAHEKFQQMLHKKWGQRDRALPVGGSGVRGYNIFWYGITTSYVLCPKLMLARGWRMLQASWGRTGKHQQEQTSPNHVQALNSGPVLGPFFMRPTHTTTCVFDFPVLNLIDQIL